MKIFEIAKNVLKKYSLCNYCFGRQFSMLGYGLTNYQRGDAIKLCLVLEASRLMLRERNRGKELLKSVALNGSYELAYQTLKSFGVKIKPTKKSCYLCDCAFNYLDELVEAIVKKLSRYDFENFLVGIKVKASVEDSEDELRAKFKIKWGENIRNNFSREIGKRLAKATEKKVNFKRPDIIITVNPFTKRIVLKSNSLFVYGHYRKLIRGIPQSKWFCSSCGGKGCKNCNWSGKLYPESIEELISQPLLQTTAGSNVKFHVSGREDIDVRVLGSGRPFVMEILNPIKRRIDLENLEKKINKTLQGKIEVEGLEFTSKEKIKKIKTLEKAKKSYRALAIFEEKVSNEAISKLKKNLQNTIIYQQTPTRVMYRRANKVRKKRLISLKLEKLGHNLIEFFLTCEGGLYIKEFINGDKGRTNPSIVNITKIPAKCVELDVIDICKEES